MHLTDNQKKVLLFIVSFIQDKKYPPTSREIQTHFGWRSQTSAVKYLHELRRKGHITWVDGAGRTINITKP